MATAILASRSHLPSLPEECFSLSPATIAVWSTVEPTHLGPKPRNGCLPAERESRHHEYTLRQAVNGRLALCCVIFLHCGAHISRVGAWSDGNQRQILTICKRDGIAMEGE